VLAALWLTPALNCFSGAAVDPLSSWNDGPVKQAILDFVARVCDASSAEFVAPKERIAAFDDDGTLWPEQPVYFQAQFVIDRVKELAPTHPQWQIEHPFKELLAGDMASALGTGEKDIATLVVATHVGTTTEEFRDIVNRWISTARHPRFQRPYLDLTYEPMLELLQWLRGHGFKTYIVSGAGVDFLRPWVERTAGISPEQAVGSTIRLRYEMRGGAPVLVRLAQLDVVEDGPGKPAAIQKYIGRAPLIAFGNSDGDREMLEWTKAQPGARLAALIHHTDAVREWAYDRQSRVGRLDAALDEARADGWLVVDMKADWGQVFPFEGAARLNR
jgi:phosphoserine phosphatase